MVRSAPRLFQVSWVAGMEFGIQGQSDMEVGLDGGFAVGRGRDHRQGFRPPALFALLPNLTGGWCGRRRYTTDGLVPEKIVGHKMDLAGKSRLILMMVPGKGTWYDSSVIKRLPIATDIFEPAEVQAFMGLQRGFSSPPPPAVAAVIERAYPDGKASV